MAHRLIDNIKGELLLFVSNLYKIFLKSNKHVFFVRKSIYKQKHTLRHEVPIIQDSTNAFFRFVRNIWLFSMLSSRGNNLSSEIMLQPFSLFSIDTHHGIVCQTPLFRYVTAHNIPPLRIETTHSWIGTPYRIHKTFPRPLQCFHKSLINREPDQLPFWSVYWSGYSTIGFPTNIYSSKYLISLFFWGGK